MPLITRFINLCFLQAGPQHVPASSFLLVLCAATYVITGTVSSAFTYPWALAAQTTMADAVVLVIFTNIALAVRGFPQRSTQTMVALMGVGVLFHLIVMLMASMSMPTVLFFVLLLWNAVVIAHILRYALNIPLMFGFGLTVFYVFVSVAVTLAITADKVG